MLLHNLIKLKHLALLVILCLPAFVVATAPVKQDSIYKVHSTMSSLPVNATLYVSDSIPASVNCSKSILEAKLKIRLRLGETYAFGSSAFTSQVKVKIEAYPTFAGSSPLQTWWAELNINESNPEEVFIKDFTVDHSLIKRFETSIYSYTAPGGSKNDSVQVFITYDEKFGIQIPSNLDIDNVTLSSIKSPVTFKWTRGTCPDIPNYQFQLLRIYNNACAACTTDVTDIDAVVDWNKALTIETGGSDTTLKLSIMEGTGYYIWRVRPIGTYYDGGISDSRNWGTWSDTYYSQGGTYSFDNTSTAANKFYYTQFDDTLNWIYSRVFSEGDPLSTKVRIGEKMNYANGLLQSKQNQGHSQSMQEVVVNQTIYDWSGRPALVTLPAPLSNDTMYYRKGFVRVGSNLYTAANFDEDNNYKNPAAVTHGVLTDYYSNSNADLTVPNAEGYPFSRNLYERDGNARVKEQSSPGETHRLKITNSHTTQTLYGGVSDMELIRIFGDEAPSAEGVHKVITVDPNAIASINYISKEGQTIATCLSVCDSALQDTLTSQASARFDVIDTVKGNTAFGEYGIVSSKPLVLATPTDVDFYYSISANSISDICTGLCNTCDYTIELMIKADDTTYAAGKLLASHLCGGSAPSWDTTFSKTLPAGSYIIQKQVYANNYIDSTHTVTYLDQHLDSLRERILDTMNAYLASVYTHLANSDLTSLYGAGCLNINTGVANPDSVFADSTAVMNVGCTSIHIPILACPGYSCPGNAPDFEAYFNARWAGTSYVGTDGGGYLNYFPNNLSVGMVGFQPGQFNTLVSNMLSSSGDAYTCQQLWQCWERLTQSYSVMKSLSDTTAYNLDLLHEFLTCTGTKFSGFDDSDASKYREQAYQWFYYDTGDKPYCDTIFEDLYGALPWAQDGLYDSITDQKYRNYYLCTRNMSPDSIAPGTSEVLANMECGCKGVCEDRYESFKTKLIQMYHNDSIYVEGDLYQLRSDSTWGQLYAYDTIALTSISDSVHFYRSMAEIECAAYSLVEECKKSCAFTVYSTLGQVDSVGSPAEILAAQQAMTWNFELQLGPSCGMAYEQIKPYGTNADTLNKIWEQHYGSAGNDVLMGMARDKNGCGGYLLAGFTGSTDTLHDVSDTLRGDYDYWIIRVDCDGHKLWDKRIGGSDEDILTSVFQTRDGGYIVAGTSVSDSTSEKTDSSRWNSGDYWVVRIDPNGSILWDKTYGGSGEDNLVSIIETSDGNLLIGGNSNSPISGEKTVSRLLDYNTDFWVIKTDASGNKIWDKVYGSGADDKLGDLAEARDGNYLIGGSCTGDGGNRTVFTNNYDYWVVKTDTAGNFIWDKCYGGDDDENLLTIEVSELENDSSIILIGCSASDSYTSSTPGAFGKTQDGFGKADAWVVKIHPNGTPVWDHIYGGDRDENVTRLSLTGIKQVKDYGYILGVVSNSNPGTGNKVDSCGVVKVADYWLVRIDSAGNKLWDRSFVGTESDIITAVDVDENSNYWLAGASPSDSTGGINGNKKTHNYDFTLSGHDFWLIKAREGHDGFWQ